MAGVYSSVDDIDLITGGLAETSVSGGLIGPTFACILGKQFNALMFGDRYFFTHSSGPGHRGLPGELRKEMRRRTLRDVMCENTDIRSLQRHVMKRTDRSNPESSCDSVNEFNWDVVIDNLAFEEEEEEPEAIIVTQPEPTVAPTEAPTEPPTEPTEDNRKPQPQPVKPNTPKPKPTPVKPNPPKPKPNPVPVRPKPPPKPKPQPSKPKPQPPRPVDESSKCVKDKLSFCQWKIPSCATSEKTRRDCCKSCGGRHG